MSLIQGDFEKKLQHLDQSLRKKKVKSKWYSVMNFYIPR